MARRGPHQFDCRGSEWKANARGAAWEQEPRTREPAAFLPNVGLCKEAPDWGAKPPEAGRLVP